MQEASALLPVASSADERVAHGRVGKIAAISAAVLLVVVGTAAATNMITVRVAMPRDAMSIQKKDFLVVKPAYEDCANKPNQDCLAPRCCGASGYNCYKIHGDKGRCMKECTPGGSNGTCEGVAPHTSKVVEYPGLSFYCFAVYVKDTGNDKLNEELDLFTQQHDRSVGIFSCAEWNVFSDVVVSLGGKDKTTQVHDVKRDWHLMKRKGPDNWINTGMFVQVWSAIKDAGHYKNHNWLIKADADAVFFPAKLAAMLRPVGVPPEGIYMENCKYVDWGYFGNLEVFSKQAFTTLVYSLEECYTAVPWKIGVHNGKYGPMGEDLFAQQCMDLKKVSKLEMFELTTDGACPSDRPVGQEKNKKYIPNCVGTKSPSIHPFKKPAAWFQCHDEASQE